MTTFLTILLTILGIAIFALGSYFMGNYVLNTFNSKWRQKIGSSFFGILLWYVVFVIGILFYYIYIGAHSLILNYL